MAATPEESFWLLRLIYNILGYATVSLPMALLVWYVRKKNLFQSEHDSRSYYVKFARLLVYGKLEYEKPSLELAGQSETAPRVSSDATRSVVGSAFVLAFCFLGLQVSYLTWGVLQEKIMTQEYYSGASETGERFRDSQFLVFVNRILAFIFAAIYLSIAKKQPPHTAPFYKYSFCSFSNILSSWFQYEALKFVSFPTQVLAKASKIIPVMLMGKLISRKSYHNYEYATAILISVGMSMFLLAKPEDGKVRSHVESTSLSGAVILAGYMILDSFTSNWQGELFTQYKMSSIQMMCGVNFFSSLLTVVSLLQQGALFASIRFALTYHVFAYDCVLLSICSATGQLFVFYTISQYGPVTFVIMMTIRQAVAILLSCLLFSHSITPMAIMGVIIIFCAIFFKVWYGQNRKRRKPAVSSPTKPAHSPAAVRLLKPEQQEV